VFFFCKTYDEEKFKCGVEIKVCVLEVTLDLTTVILGPIVAIMGGIVGIIWAKNSKLNPKIVNSRIKHFEDRIDELEIDNKKLRGKIAQSKQIPSVQGDYNLDNIDGVESLIKSVLPHVKGILPKELQSLVDDPGAVKIALDLYKQNPDKAKNILNKFIKKGKSEEGEIPAGL